MEGNKWEEGRGTKGRSYQPDVDVRGGEEFDEMRDSPTLHYCFRVLVGA